MQQFAAMRTALLPQSRIREGLDGSKVIRSVQEPSKSLHVSTA